MCVCVGRECACFISSSAQKLGILDGAASQKSVNQKFDSGFISLEKDILTVSFLRIRSSLDCTRYDSAKKKKEEIIINNFKYLVQIAIYP